MATSTRLGSLRLGQPDNAEPWAAVEVPIEVAEQAEVSSALQSFGLDVKDDIENCAVGVPAGGGADAPSEIGVGEGGNCAVPVLIGAVEPGDGPSRRACGSASLPGVPSAPALQRLSNCSK
jgi:hypothetical protein